VTRNCWISIALCALCSVACTPSSGATSGASAGAEREAETSAWVGSWVSAQQLTEERNLPPAPGLPSSTLRQMAQLSLGGERLRFSFSNQFGTAPLTLTSAHVALSTGGSAIDAASDAALTFTGKPSVTIPAGASVTSDAVVRQVPALTNLAVTIAFDAAPPSDVTGHPGSRTTSYLQPGNVVAAPQLAAAQAVDHWYFLSAIDVWTERSARAIVTLGDSITDGRGSTTNQNDRWPNQLSRRLLADPNTARVAVLNQGVGGNRVLAEGLGVTALARFERDVLAPPGVRWVVILEGINDLGATPPATADALIGAFRQMITSAHERNVRAYGATILPFEGAQYFTPAGEAARQAFNAWVRSSGEFDGVVDFDAIARDPAAPTRLSAAVDGGDHLHPSAAGYQILADGIDLGLFRQ
jgi:lysophospholipase L1-like esterase